METETQDTFVVARTLADLGQLSDARSVLVAGLRLARDQADQLDAMVKELGASCERMRDTVGALSCAWYRLDWERVEALENRVGFGDRARSWVLRGGASAHEPGRVGCHARAAALFDAEGRGAHAADQWERAGELARSLERWRALAQRAGRYRYVQALCGVQEARIAWQMGREGDADAACERALAALRWVGGEHARHGRADLAAACHALVFELCGAWQRPDLAAEAKRAWEHETRRDVGRVVGDVGGGRLAAVTGELLAWENAWEITEHTADWMSDPRSRVVPVVALELRLLALETEGKPTGAVVYALSRLAHGLGDAGYEALGPLEVLSMRRSAAVRLAVVRSLSRLPGMRALRALTRALGDPDAGVVQAALEGIEAMRCPEALGGLLALIGAGAYGGGMRRDPATEATRRAALAALGAMRHAGALAAPKAGGAACV